MLWWHHTELVISSRLRTCLGYYSHAYAIFFDNVADNISICHNRLKFEKLQCRVATVWCWQNMKCRVNANLLEWNCSLPYHLRNYLDYLATHCMYFFIRYHEQYLPFRPMSLASCVSGIQLFNTTRVSKNGWHPHSLTIRCGARNRIIWMQIKVPAQLMLVKTSH